MTPHVTIPTSHKFGLPMPNDPRPFERPCKWHPNYLPINGSRAIARRGIASSTTATRLRKRLPHSRIATQTINKTSKSLLSSLRRTAQQNGGRQSFMCYPEDPCPSIHGTHSIIVHSRENKPRVTDVLIRESIKSERSIVTNPDDIEKMSMNRRCQTESAVKQSSLSFKTAVLNRKFHRYHFIHFNDEYPTRRTWSLGPTKSKRPPCDSHWKK
jgi:hypothetical protein